MSITSWLMADEPVPGGRGLVHRALRLVSAHSLAADAILAGAVAVLGLPQVLSHAGPAESPGVWLGMCALVLPLLWRRRYPLAVFGIVWAAAAALLLSGRNLVAAVAVLVALYTVAAGAARRAAAAAALAAETAVAIGWLAGALGPGWWLELPYLSVLIAVSFLLGTSVRDQRAFQAAEARLAVADERASIAREMHDIVAHSLTVMITMSDAAVRKQRAEPDRAVAAMRQVSATGRQALDETRRLLGILRAGSPAVLAPQPGLAELSGLVDQVRETGLAADVAVTGTPFPLHAGAELALYRIVQEGLTNAIKHARDVSRVQVTLRYAEPVVEVEISDDGNAVPADRTVTRPGHGLCGMAERAMLYRGTVTAGPRPERGWVVRARLDLAG